MRVDEQKLNEASRRDEQALHCEVHIHQEPRRRLSDCAWKAAGITPGGLFCVAERRLREPRGNLTAGQKSAEGVVVAQAMKA
jgi:hypothetical protein